ncbi:hypothetical protein MRX96_009343 [Rhipicephalus microplus]
MTGMGDGPQATTANTFMKLLRYLEPMHRQPTTDENGFIEPSVRLADLTRLVCVQDSVVALGTAEMRSKLCIMFLLTLRPSRAIIVGENIGEDVDFLDYLRLFISRQVRFVCAPTSCSLGDFRDTYAIVEPDVLWTMLKNSVLQASDIDALVIRDFERYQDASHAYCKVLSCFQQPVAAKSSTRILALTDGLQIDSIEDLEKALRRLRTPLGLKCHLATPAAPYSKEVSVELCPLEVNWSGDGDWMWAIDEMSCSGDPKVQGVSTALSEWGISVACCEALKTFAASPSSQLGEFLVLSRMALTPLKGCAILNYVQGRTLALTNTVAAMHDLDKWLRQEGSATVIDQPDDVALALSVVLVATTADMATLKRYCWDAIILCDLPFGVSCDALFANADRKVALATEHEWKRWTELLELHDDLDKLMIRVNELPALDQ